MKATAKTSVAPERATEMAGNIISAFGQSFLSDPEFGICSCDDDWHACQCAAKYERISWTQDGVSTEWDCYGAELGLYFAPNMLLLQGITCSGTVESIAIFLATGEIIYTHDGNRRSGGGSIWNLLPESWREINNVSRWNLERCETSRPEWGVSLPLLQGQFGDGPCNEEEALQAEAEKKLQQLRIKCEAAKYPMPADLTAMVDLHEPVVGSWDKGDIFRPWRPSFDGIHYRRAAANGIRL